MKTCRICGETKDDKEFYRLKGFSNWCKRNVVWCAACMKLFVDMKKKQRNEKALEEKEWVFQLRFD